MTPARNKTLFVITILLGVTVVACADSYQAVHTAAMGHGQSDGNTGSPCSSARTLQQDGVRVSVSVAPGEPCSVGTFDIVASFRDGGTQRFQAERDGTIANVWLVDLTADGALDLVITCCTCKPRRGSSYTECHR
jgi:hypothetical protein